MSVKLYDGCWGVTQNGHAFGPAKDTKYGVLRFLVGTLSYREDGACPSSDDVVWDDWQIIAVFPSESSARAWLDRKPWWKRQFWQGFFDWRCWVAGALLTWFAVWLTGCAAPNITTPHDARCVDGLHTHKETK